MKTFLERNHYELLEVSPGASPLEIRRAYKRIFDLYQDESAATYSFFSESERREILDRLEEAFLILCDAESREAYDRGLVEKGLLDEEARYHDKMKDPIPIYDFRKVHPDAHGPAKHREELRLRTEQNQVVRHILAGNTLTGSDIKRIRTEMEISLAEISEMTCVRIEMLQAIEDENRELFLPRVYMEGFVKAYMKYLQVDEVSAVRRYFKHLDEQEQFNRP